MERYACAVPGCGRAFIRKEHLTRHAQSHAAASYVCPTCGRGFVRNDVLQRHIARHAESEPFVRNKRACDRCHTNKTRCNGGLPCLSCKRRGVECKDERGLTLRTSENEQAKGKNQQWVRDQFQSDVDMESFESTGEDELLNSGEPDLHPNSFQETRQSSDEYDENEAAVQETVLSPNGKETLLEHVMPGVEPGQEGILEDASTDPAAPSQDQKEYVPQVRSQYAVIYFSHFHHRWPILHAPMFDEGDKPVMLTSSVVMIGHWLEGTAESKEVAIAIHDRVSKHLFSKLMQYNPYALRTKVWPVALFEACFLNILFGLYTGKEEIMSQMIVMMGMLVSILREVGFFAPETLVDQSWPGVFIAFRWVKKEARKRLAVSLFRVDAYYSILRNKPPLLNFDEMMYSLPSTFALWNSGGFSVWDVRNAEEPKERETTTIRYLLGKTYMSANPHFQIQTLLPEDVQLGLCSVQADMWRHSKPSFTYGENFDGISLPPRKDTQRRLEFWKTRLDNMSFSELAELTTSPTSIPECFYHGLEDQTFPCWQKIVGARSDCIIAESKSLYHLLNIQLYANTRIMRLHIQENEKSGQELPIQTGLFERVIALKEWAQSRDARKALWHAMWILFHENISDHETKEASDPIVHIASSVAAMVVWIYGNYAYNDSIDHQCTGEISGNTSVDPAKIRDRSDEIAELTSLDGFRLDDWLDKGGLVTIGKILVCQCTTTLLMATLNAHLPPSGNQGWIWN